MGQSRFIERLNAAFIWIGCPVSSSDCNAVQVAPTRVLAVSIAINACANGRCTAGSCATGGPPFQNGRFSAKRIECTDRRPDRRRGDV